MTFRYTDPDGRALETHAATDRNGNPVVIVRNRRGRRSANVEIPVDRVEELIAGIRDTARQAAGGTT